MTSLAMRVLERDLVPDFIFRARIRALLARRLRDVRILEHWRVPGWRYRLMIGAWLANMDRHRDDIMPVLARTSDGNEWMVSHYLFEKR